MLTEEQINGSNLQPFTLSLTFDDGPGKSGSPGPGPKTVSIAEFLFEEGIQAAFFVVGKCIKQYPESLSRLKELGHLIGNHTYTHLDLIKGLAQGNNLQAEIDLTSALLKDHITDQNVYFRAPYGHWSPEIARQLNERLDNSINYVGPFYWDISANDYSFWFDGESAASCAAAYMAEIQRINKGIILMHDSTADNEVMKKNNLTYEVVKLIVPMLKAKGYKFIRLDEVTSAEVAKNR